MKKIIIGADFVSTELNLKEFSEGNVKSLIDGEVYSAIKNADFSIMNLELPFIEKPSAFIKTPADAMGQQASAVNGYTELGIDLVVTANNHILDHGKEGLLTNIKTLNKAGIPYIGSGLSLEEAKKPYIFDFDGIKIGVYNCCDHQFSAVQDHGYGCYVFDPLDSLDEIKELKSKVDYLIMLYHGGLEHYRYCSPYVQKLCRKLVDCGADLVICQHTHCVGAEEDYNGAKIIYGQGNAFFDEAEPYYHNHPCWQSGMYVCLEHLGNAKFKFSYIPCHLLDGRVSLDKTGEIMKGYYERTEQIKDPAFVKQNYIDFCKHEFLEYEGGLKRFDTLYLLNALQCEQHRELLMTVFRDDNGIKTI